MILDFWLGKCLLPDGQSLLSHGLNSSNLTNENYIVWSHFEQIMSSHKSNPYRPKKERSQPQVISRGSSLLRQSNLQNRDFVVRTDSLRICNLWLVSLVCDISLLFASTKLLLCSHR